MSKISKLLNAPSELFLDVFHVGGGIVLLLLYDSPKPFLGYYCVAAIVLGCLNFVRVVRQKKIEDRQSGESHVE